MAREGNDAEFAPGVKSGVVFKTTEEFTTNPHSVAVEGNVEQHDPNLRSYLQAILFRQLQRRLGDLFCACCHARKMRQPVADFNLCFGD